MDLVAHIRTRIEVLETLVRRALAAAGSLAGISRIQAGTTQLAMGTKTVAGFVITANSRIVATFNTAAGGGGSTVKLDVPQANRVPGAPGTFDIMALTAGDVVNAMDTSTVDFVIIN